MGESGGTCCNLTLPSWGGCSSLSPSGNGAWDSGECTSESLQAGGWGAGRATWPQPCQGRGLHVSRACGRVHQQRRRLAGSCWRNPSWHGLETALFCSAVWASPHALNPSSPGGISGWLPRQGEEPKVGSVLIQSPLKQRHATWK